MGEIVDQVRQSTLALLRLPVVGVDALQALAELPRQLQVLIDVVESTNSLMASTAAGIDAAAAGIAGAVTSVRGVVDLLDVSLPGLAGGAESLVDLARGLSEAAGILAVDLPRVAGSLDGVSPELVKLVDGLDGRLDHLDAVVTQLGSVVTGAVGIIPGMRRALRGPDASPS